MASAIARLREAVEADDAARAEAPRDKPGGAEAVPLRARVWPMVEMFKRALAADEPVVWGV